MEDEKKAAETTETSEVDSHADVDQDKGQVNDVEFTDDKSDSEQPQGGNAKKEAEGTQTKEQNSENARRRREAERKAELERERQTAREQAIIETLNGKNPYTGEEMKDSTDVQEYLTMKEIEKSGGDPLSDYSKHLKKKEREKAEETRKAETEKEWYRKDYADFATKHPEVNVENLIQNEQFQKFASGKVGNLPLSEIYEGFMEMVEEYERKAEKKAKQILANSKATPGSLSSTSPSDNGFFTREQVQKMTQEEVHKNYDKIRASMSKWK